MSVRRQPMYCLREEPVESHKLSRKRKSNGLHRSCPIGPNCVSIKLPAVSSAMFVKNPAGSVTNAGPPSKSLFIQSTIEPVRLLMSDCPSIVTSASRIHSLLKFADWYVFKNDSCTAVAASYTGRKSPNGVGGVIVGVQPKNASAHFVGTKSAGTASAEITKRVVKFFQHIIRPAPLFWEKVVLDVFRAYIIGRRIARRKWVTVQNKLYLSRPPQSIAVFVFGI